MGTTYSSKKFAEFLFDESDKVAEEKSIWKSTRSGRKSLFGDSSIDSYKFLESFAGGMEPNGKKVKSKTVIVHEVDEAVKERIFRSDAALQSSSSNYNANTSSGSRCPDLCSFYRGESFKTRRSLKAATARKDSNCTQQFHLADNEPVSISSDEDNDNSTTTSSNDIADTEGSSGEGILEHKITSHEMDSSVVVYPKYVTHGINCYWKAQLTFFCSSIKLVVFEEEGPMGSLTFEWKTADLISIESRWLDPFITAEVCLHIKSEHPELAASGKKSGILEVEFTVSDPRWTDTQELIKLLDEQYKEKWDVDLDSYESFEDITYLEGDCGCVSISKRDFQLLQPEKFINDTIVDFYIEYLKKKIKPADERIHFFNSFFFRKLADFDENQLRVFDAKEAFQQVRKWTKKVDIFQKDYIFIPVNFRLHWSLIVICHPGEVVNFADEELANSVKVPCILHMDSISGSHRGLEYCIRCYLWEEWKERSSDAAEDVSRKFMNLRFLHLEVPQQQNWYDCGLFMLHYMELFVKQAPANFNPLSNFVNKDWFYPTEASLKRARIKRLIFELAKSNSKQVLSPSCNDNTDVNEEESEVQFLHETCKSKETYRGTNSDTSINRSTDVSPIIAEPLRSELDLSSELPHELQSHCEEFPKTGDNGGSLIADNEHNHGPLVLYDPGITVLSLPIKGSDETEDVLDDKQLAVIEPSPRKNTKTNKIESFMSCIDKTLNLLQLKGNEASGCSDDVVVEALVVEDTDECSSSSDDDVCETCVVEDSDSDKSCEVVVGGSSSIRKYVAGNRLNSKRKRAAVSEGRKRLK